MIEDEDCHEENLLKHLLLQEGQSKANLFHLASNYHRIQKDSRELSKFDLSLDHQQIAELFYEDITQKKLLIELIFNRQYHLGKQYFLKLLQLFLSLNRKR